VPTGGDPAVGDHSDWARRWAGRRGIPAPGRRASAVAECCPPMMRIRTQNRYGRRPWLPGGHSVSCRTGDLYAATHTARPTDARMGAGIVWTRKAFFLRS
jgi:hypothetical protein